jgi:hypothetical protein
MPLAFIINDERNLVKTYNIHHLNMAFRILFVFLVIAVIPVELLAQQTRHTSIFGWEEQTQHMIKNRYHNYGGIFYDRGLYRFTTPEMTREHELDLITRDFTTVNDYDWYYNRSNSFRGFAGSYNLGKFLHGAVVRNYIRATENLDIPLTFTRRFDLHTDRALLELGADYNISGDHNAGITHTVTEQKPDLDATFYYRFGHYPRGYIQVEFTPLDWANNASYELSERRGDPFPGLQNHKVKPYLFSIKASTHSIHNMRGELTAGIQTVRESETDGFEDIEEPFRDRDRTRYLGILLEYAIPQFTAAVSWQHRYARFSRSNLEFTSDEPIHYGNRQTHNSLGLFLSYNYRGFYLDNWIWRKYNRDKQFDNVEERFRSGFQTYPFDFEENRIKMRNRLGYDPGERGFLAALEWSADYRDFLRGTVDHPSYGIVHAFDYRDHYIRQLSERQERLTFFFGYRFTENAWFELGVSYDADGDKYRGAFDQAMNQNSSRFDGGFGRMMLYW